MQVTITKMHLEKFLSFGEADFDFDNSGLVFVAGENHDDPSSDSNGSGKSAMICAVVWCLFGITLRGYEKDEVVHRKAKNGEGCVVVIDLEVNGGPVRVGRARRHQKHKNSLWLSANGADASGASAAETQWAIERALGCTRSTFLSSVVFGQDRAYRFSSLTDGEQKKILDEVLGVERFAQACATARKKVSGLASELEIARRVLEQAEAARQEAEADGVDLKAKDADFAAAQWKKIEAEREHLAEAKDWLNKTRKVANVDALKKTTSDALKVLAACEKTLDKLVDVEAIARSLVTSVKDKLDAAESDLRARRKDPGKCPTCGQQVERKAGAVAVAELAEKAKRLKEELDRKVEVAAETASALADEKRAVKDARAAMSAAQVALNEGVGREADAASWRRRRIDHEKRIAELEAEVSPYAALAEKALARCGVAEIKVAQLTRDIAELDGAISRAEFWVKAFGAQGLRSLLIDSSLPLLNQEAARVSRAVTGGSIAIEFSATSEQKSGKVVDKFEVRVDNRHGAGDYRGNSAGERAKVDLCVGLALQRLVASRSAASFNLCFFDEVFDHLDSAAHERVVEVLTDIKKDSVFVVSHNEDLRAFFPNVLTIKKEGGFSSVEQ